MMSFVDEFLAWAGGSEEWKGHRFFKTSGSSGVEKWVAISDEALEWSARVVVEALNITSEDVLGLALPEEHVGGFGLVTRARVSGAKLRRFEGKWEPRDFASWCGEVGVTVSSLVPTQVYDLVRGGVKGVGSVRVVVVGGGKVEDEMLGQVRELGWPVVPSYGMTETSSQVATGDGLPLLPGWEAKVADGCLALKGGGLLTAVIRRDREEFVVEDPKVDGWLVTSDFGEVENGCVKVLGRSDRRVKVLGKLVDLEELENWWVERIGGEVAVVAIEHARRGYELYLFATQGEELVTDLNQTRPGVERVGGWSFMESLPRTSLGKLDRVAMKKILSELR